jgi:hypothetical protein
MMSERESLLCDGCTQHSTALVTPLLVHAESLTLAWSSFIVGYAKLLSDAC